MRAAGGYAFPVPVAHRPLPLLPLVAVTLGVTTQHADREQARISHTVHGVRTAIEEEAASYVLYARRTAMPSHPCVRGAVTLAVTAWPCWILLRRN
jgi:hypothetical protein